MAILEQSAPAGQLLVRAGRITQWTGAAVSLALVAGVAIWGYKLLVRDMTGIPVVRAMEGAVREAPANPGGEIVPHLGLSVNAVAAAGEAAPPEERLLLAPRQTELSEDDLLAMPTAEAEEPNVGADGAAVETPVAANALALQPQSDPSLLTDPAPVAVAMSDQTVADAPMTAADVLALADQIATGAEPLAALPDAPVVALIDRAVPGVATALIPQARPASLVANAAVAPAVTDAAPALTGDIPVGTSLVQLGAYETPELAAVGWDTLGRNFAEFMTGKERVIQQASRGGLSFYRLRAMGFSDLSDARRFCAALAAEDAACVPVVVR